MTAFLFDEDHSELNVIFDPQCASFIIKALEDIPNLPALRILRGSMLHRRYCYELCQKALFPPLQKKKVFFYVFLFKCLNYLAFKLYL